MKINSQYIKVSEKDIFLRYAGKGFPVLVFHQSPQSSIASVEWIKALSSEFLVIAPDTPGYGFSSSLDTAGQVPTIEDFANALIALVNELQLTQFAVVGTHTGAAIAAKIAALCPERVCAAFLDGFPVFEPHEAISLLEGYLPEFTPIWDGSHLAWLWSRIREQSLFFPWFKRDEQHRLDLDCRDAKAMHDWALDFLLAGKSYHTAYAAAFAENGKRLSEQIHCPALYCYHKDDPLKEHSNRLDFSDAKRVLKIVSPCGPNKFETSIEFIRKNMTKIRGENSPTYRLACRREAKRHIINKTEANISCYRTNRGRSKSRLWLHELSHSLASVIEYLPADSQFNEYAIDLPGHGQTEVPAELYEPQAFAEFLLDGLSFSPEIILVEGGSSAYAVAIASQLNTCQVVGINSWCPEKIEQRYRLEHYFPDLSPTWNGSHLSSAWQASRLSRLFWPWFETSSSNKLPLEPRLNDLSIAQDTLDWIISASNLPKILANLTRSKPPGKAFPDLTCCYNKYHPCKKYSPDIASQLIDINGNLEQLWDFAKNQP